MFVRDLSEGERRTFPKTKLLLHVIGHFAPQQLRSRPNANDTTYEDVVGPARLSTFIVGRSCLSGMLKPNQDMDNLIIPEHARGRWGEPAYNPSSPRRSRAPTARIFARAHDCYQQEGE